MTALAQSTADIRTAVAHAVPTLQAKAEWVDENRRLHDDTLAVLVESGALRMRTPARYGGSEVDNVTLSRVVAEVAKGDGSAAWNTAVWAMCSWLAGLFPDHVQDEVFSRPDVRVCGVLSPTAMGRPDGGDLVIDGRWSFISGALDSHWQVVLALAPTPDGASMWPVMALVPMSDLATEDDWTSAGLRGTGSITTVANGVRVPMDRVLPMPLVLQEQYASQINVNSPVWRAAMMPAGCATFAGVAVGLARAALDGFVERLDGRKITYSNYESQREAPITHHQVAEAAYLADEAEFHATRVAELVDRVGRSGERWGLADRVAARAGLGRTFSLADRAVDVLAKASGASSLYSGVAIQRIRRDVQALNLHALMHPSNNAELYGRVLVGLEPNSAYL